MSFILISFLHSIDTNLFSSLMFSGFSIILFPKLFSPFGNWIPNVMSSNITPFVFSKLEYSIGCLSAFSESITFPQKSATSTLFSLGLLEPLLLFFSLFSLLSSFSWSSLLDFVLIPWLFFSSFVKLALTLTPCTLFAFGITFALTPCKLFALGITFALTPCILFTLGITFAPAFCTFCATSVDNFTAIFPFWMLPK